VFSVVEHIEGRFSVSSIAHLQEFRMQPDNGITPDPHTNGAPLPAPAVADPGLPPVAPPSGKFILQLFLVPGLIVAVLIGIWLVSRWLFGDPHSPAKFLKGLDDANPEVRWRAAADLSQVLPRDETLATDSAFALELTTRLKRFLAENETSERVHREQARKDKQAGEGVPKMLQTERELILYLISCLGAFEVPVGAPLLSEVAATPNAELDAETAFRRRVRAAWSLMVLGNNLKKYDRLAGDKKFTLLAGLKEEAAAAGDRGQWARQALDFLDKRQSDKPARGLGVGEALIRCARAEAPFLRELAAGALNFWDAPGADEALTCLASDQGEGHDPVERDEQQKDYRKKHPDKVRLRHQKTIAYNAVLALARRGSPHVKDHFALFKEMLDEEGQVAFWKTDEPNQKSAAEAEAREIVVRTLQALDQLHRENASVDLTPLRPIIDRLADSPHASVKSAARELQKKL
jgi:hypothetical protein